ncbi:17535_t:CDS:1, partial [Cetraspora pellucida]
MNTGNFNKIIEEVKYNYESIHNMNDEFEEIQNENKKLQQKIKDYEAKENEYEKIQKENKELLKKVNCYENEIVEYEKNNQDNYDIISNYQNENLLLKKENDNIKQICDEWSNFVSFIRDAFNLDM